MISKISVASIVRTDVLPLSIASEKNAKNTCPSYCNRFCRSESAAWPSTALFRSKKSFRTLFASSSSDITSTPRPNTYAATMLIAR